MSAVRSFHYCNSPPPLASTAALPRFPTSLRFSRKKPLGALPSLHASPSHIFLPHLDAAEAPEPSPQGGLAVSDDELEPEDPIVEFLRKKKGAEVADPSMEGSLTLQSNRRSSWHIADVANGDLDGGAAGEENDVENFEEDVEGLWSLDDDDEEDEAVEEQGADTSSAVINRIMRIARNLPENVTLGELMEPFVGEVDEGACIELLKVMGKEGLVQPSLYLFEWMRLQVPTLVTPRSCSVLFPVLGRAGMGDKVIVLLENLPTGKRFRDVCVYNAAITGLAFSRRYEDAWRVFEIMKSNNVRPDHVTCSILISVMRRSGKTAKDAWGFFEEMSKKGVKWSLEVVGALMKFFCDEGLKKEAIIMQSEMEKRGIASNTIIYNTLMDAYGKSNQVEQMEGLFAEMKEKGLQPTTATYNILIDAYSRRMQPEIAESLLSEMQMIGLEPNVKSYTCLISAYGRQRKMSERAADAFLRMKKAGIRPTSHSYTALIHAYSVGGWHEKAYMAYDNMTRDGVKPTIETYTALLDACRRSGDTEKLMEIWKSMIHEKVECTRVTFNIVLDGLAKRGFYALARDVIFEFRKMGLPPTVMTYNILMNAYARGGDHYRLPRLLQEMKHAGLVPDSVTYSTMIYAYLRVRDFTRAFYYHKEMVKNGQVPEATAYRKMRALLEVKANVRNRRDKKAALGIVNSKFGIVKPKKGKKDEFWKFKRSRPAATSRITSIL